MWGCVLTLSQGVLFQITVLRPTSYRDSTVNTFFITWGYFLNASTVYITMVRGCGFMKGEKR
jgi:hypothetical protein